ncbi:DUF500-domain-containing protein [Neolentinus lepideus HHB14362 ss-1]|uniref:DUF500-domain-containing protein n=1 Tax=Neolentinus lepideus HHB14362 ss-1 TaxID=1314782 RepID=A0A165RGW7_9AGAM|nr:DUF500-domain-containing protein [Neolentinus lepideus HHB14362 ss-1]
MKLNTPLPQPLPKECDKAAKTFKSFVDSGNNGLDGVIPRSVLENAKGFAILTIFKAGFLFSARAGSGIVIARLDDGTWSAPSAIGTAGVGVGGQAGAEVTDFLIVLNTRSAIRSFMSAGSLTLGGNMSIAVGPLGRNGEASGSLSTGGKMSAMYSYSKTKGLFGGVSIEGSVMVERQDANTLAYRSQVSVKQLLSGAIPPPEWAQPLIRTLELCTGLPGTRKWVSDEPLSPGGGYAFNGLESPRNQSPSGRFSPFGKKKKGGSPFPPPSWGRKKSNGSYFSSDFHDDYLGPRASDELDGIPPEPEYRSTTGAVDPTSNFETHFDSDFTLEDKARQKHPRLTVSPDHTSSTATYDLYEQGSHFNTFSAPSKFAPNAMAHTRSFSSGSTSATRASPLAKTHSAQSKSDPFAYASVYSSGRNGSNSSLHSDDLNVSTPSEKPIRPLRVRPELSKPLHEGVGRCIALYDFDAVQSGDLSFRQGDVITILEKSNNADTWWKGKINGRTGVFPANRVELV